MAAQRTADEYQADEVAWYRKHGRYQSQRIRRDGKGLAYVIGDDDWNKICRPREYIEPPMAADLKANAKVS